MKYEKHMIGEKWVIVEKDKDYTHPQKMPTFAFDTETLLYLDGKIEDQYTIFKKLKGVKDEEKRRRLESKVWAFQVYDEVNGFFMTNDFYLFCEYVCKARMTYGWCYNATFDFAQLDYLILAEGSNLWKPHQRKQEGEASYNKKQPYTYESLHNDVGARYCYKLWYPYKAYNRHVHVHAFELRDFMKLLGGGLKNLLNDLNVVDNEGNPIRKLDMDYQAVNTENLTEQEINYCYNDVKGLYFAIKQFNKIVEEQTENELHVFGDETNIMTAGGLAKRELLRSMYPNFNEYKKRLAAYQREHIITNEADKYFRSNHLYRGGIAYVNPKYKGRLITNKLMYRYDVNSEYPYSMYSIRDLVRTPFKITYKEWLTYPNKNDYEAIYVLTYITGTLKKNMVGLWYDPIKKDYVDYIEEDYTHLIFERELQEYENWYDLEYIVKEVILCKRGAYIYAPYVNKNYKVKVEAKKNKNKTLQAFAKLLLNSSYGKLAERIERRKGHYELNNETGAVHFIDDGIETDAKGRMSVLVGSLITSYARCYIMSKIREVCGDNVKANFVYIDTDSIHCFCNYDKADAYTLGGLKLEATCEAIKYLLPKTYIDIEKVNNGIVDIRNLELHTKGISVGAIQKDFKRKKTLTLAYISKKINYGAKYIVLMAMNVKGGKALVPTEKYIARPELIPDLYVNSGVGYTYINER